MPSLRTFTTCVDVVSPLPSSAAASCDRGLGVVRAAALLEQLRLRSSVRVARTSAAARARSPPPGRHGTRSSAARAPPRRAHRSSAGSTTARRRARSSRLAGSSMSSARSVDVAGEQLGQPVDPVHQGRALPGQVVEPDVVQLHPVGLHPEIVGEAALEADGDVAETDRTVTCLQQRPGDDADRVGEVDDPRVRVPPRPPARRCPARPAPSAAPSPDRRRPWSPGRRNRSPAARSRPGDAPPDRRPAAAAARRRRRPGPASRSVEVVTVAGWPIRSRIRRPNAPTSSSRSWSGSTRTSSSTGRTSRIRAKPSMSSGVYVEPPPTTASFMGALIP